MPSVTFLECIATNPLLQPLTPMQHEPARYMGMRDLLIRNGYNVTVVDAAGGLMSVSTAARRVAQSRPDILGLSGYVNRDGSVLEFNRRVLERTRDTLPGVKVLLGGPITTHEIHRREAIRALSPDFIVVGEGELPISALIASGFRAAGLDGHPGVKLDTLMEVPVLTSIGKTDLDSIDFTRPPEWFGYAMASLDWQRFCAGACKFCDAIKRRPTFVSPKRARAEFEYLVKMGWRSFFLIGPDFPSDKEASTAIADELLRSDISDKYLAFEARILEMTRVVREFSSPWQRLAQTHTTRVYLGYETGIPSILRYMGKVKTDEEAESHLPTLLDLLDMNTGFNFLLAWMLITPKSTPATVLFDLMVMRGILEKYPRTDMNLPSIFNNMRLLPGMRLHDETPADWKDHLPGSLPALYDHMDARQAKTRPGRVARAIGGFLNRGRQATYSADGVASRLLRAQTGIHLDHLIEFLLRQMDEAAGKEALREVRDIARSFDDGRILDLVLGRMSETERTEARAEAKDRRARTIRPLDGGGPS